MKIKPSKIIGTSYLSRWHILPRNRFLNIYLHKFTGSDDARALHCHPWASVSFLLKGRLIDVTQVGERYRWASVIPFLPIFRRAKKAHRIVLLDGPAWTLFITGPVVREWGFHCKSGWKHWSLMTSPDGKQIGGCGHIFRQ